MRQKFVQKVKDKEAELKSAEQKLHDEFERLRRQQAEEKGELDNKKRNLVSHLVVKHLYLVQSSSGGTNCILFNVDDTG